MNPFYVLGAVAAAIGAYWYGTRGSEAPRANRSLSRPSTAPQRPSLAAPAPAPQSQQAGTVETLLSYGAEYGDDVVRFIDEIGSDDPNTANANRRNGGA